MRGRGGVRRTRARKSVLCVLSVSKGASFPCRFRASSPSLAESGKSVSTRGTRNACTFLLPPSPFSSDPLAASPTLYALTIPATSTRSSTSPTLSPTAVRPPSLHLSHTHFVPAVWRKISIPIFAQLDALRAVEHALNNPVGEAGRTVAGDGRPDNDRENELRDRSRFMQAMRQNAAQMMLDDDDDDEVSFLPVGVGES